MKDIPTLYIVAPCYNEEETLFDSVSKLWNAIVDLKTENKISKESSILLVNDGSKDETWEIIKNLSSNNKNIKGVSLSKNKGQSMALYAGLMEAKEHADIVITLDIDLQDDISVLPEFIDKYNEGFDIVYGVRKSKGNDSKFKKITSGAYYKLLSKMGVDFMPNHAEYRLMSKRVLDALSEYKETELFLRGIVPMIGYKYTSVYYDRQDRLAGKSKYNFKKLVTMAFDAITSLTAKPIHFVLFLGIGIFFISLILVARYLIWYLLGLAIPGWTTVVLSIWLLGGLQMMSIGLIGEYISRIYIETKHRPRYFIEEKTED